MKIIAESSNAIADTFLHGGYLSASPSHLYEEGGVSAVVASIDPIVWLFFAVSIAGLVFIALLGVVFAWPLHRNVTIRQVPRQSRGLG